MHVHIFPLHFFFASLRPDFSLKVSQDSFVGLPVSLCFPGHETFYFEGVKRRKKASHNLGVRINVNPQYWSPLNRKRNVYSRQETYRRGQGHGTKPAPAFTFQDSYKDYSVSTHLEEILLMEWILHSFFQS